MNSRSSSSLKVQNGDNMGSMDHDSVLFNIIGSLSALASNKTECNDVVRFQHIPENPYDVFDAGTASLESHDRKSPMVNVSRAMLGLQVSGVLCRTDMFQTGNPLAIRTLILSPMLFGEHTGWLVISGL